MRVVLPASTWARMPRLRTAVSDRTDSVAHSARPFKVIRNRSARCTGRTARDAQAACSPASGGGESCSSPDPEPGAQPAPDHRRNQDHLEPRTENGVVADTAGLPFTRGSRRAPLDADAGAQ